MTDPSVAELGQTGSRTDASLDERLKIAEIFHSIQGEALFVGLPTVFVRLTGCPLRCTYCDTAYAFSGGDWWSIDRILDQVKQFDTPYVCVTGGEPLAQARCHKLLTSLCDDGYVVSLETGGAIDISDVDERVSRIVDIKTPDSGEESKNLLSNLDLLTYRDALKIVICGRDDYAWAKAFVRDHEGLPCPVYFSPSSEQLNAGLLADWILADRLPVRLQVQLHKSLWGNVPGR